MYMSKKAILFPAFVREYSGMENTFAHNSLPSFSSSLEFASAITGTDLTSFNFDTNNFLNDELKSQYISYIFSCELADSIKQKIINFDYTTGYSMGIYAMFYYTGSISREDGLRIIKKAYETVLETIPPNTFGMGNIIGLNMADIKTIIQDKEVEIINVNGSYNFFISGKLYSLLDILEKAKNEGAIHARLLPVGCPYHSKFISNASYSFGNFIQTLNINTPMIPAISCINQREITDSSGIRTELINNLITPLNWQDTILKMCKKGVDLFYECGAGQSLVKLNKFIYGGHNTLKFNHSDKLSD
jgi:[acyl-carrier-protein] S-malonyltransferase